MTAETATVVVAAIGAVGAFAASWRAAHTAAKTLARAEIIYVKVNHTFDDVKAELAAARTRIERLVVLLTEQRKKPLVNGETIE